MVQFHYKIIKYSSNQRVTPKLFSIEYLHLVVNLQKITVSNKIKSTHIGNRWVLELLSSGYSTNTSVLYLVCGKTFWRCFTMVSEITKIGGIKLKGGVSIGDFLSDSDKATLGVANRNLRSANRVVRETSRLQSELKSIEDAIRDEVRK